MDLKKEWLKIKVFKFFTQSSSRVKDNLFQSFQFPSRSYRGGGGDKNDYNSLHRREHHHRHHHSSHRHGEDPNGKLGGGNAHYNYGQSDSDSTIHSRKSIKSEERMKQKRLGLVLLLLIGALLIAFGIGLLIYFLLMESECNAIRHIIFSHHRDLFLYKNVPLIISK